MELVQVPVVSASEVVRAGADKRLTVRRRAMPENCQLKRTWMYSPAFDEVLPIDIPLRHYVGNPLKWIRLLKLGSRVWASKEAYRMLENWAAAQAAAYAAIDADTWCLFSEIGRAHV